MNTTLVNYGTRSYVVQSDLCLNSLIFAFSIHHSFHHHEHPAH